VTQFERPVAPRGSNGKAIGFAALGVVLALYVFMTDAIRVADQGTDALRIVLPVWFNWPLFTVALTLMGIPVFDAGRSAWRNKAALETRPTENFE
jgi:hypothetical protein